MHAMRNVTDIEIDLFLFLFVNQHLNSSKNALLGVQREEPKGNQMESGQFTAADY